MKILVTGIAGFIGSNFAETMLDLGYEITGIDSFTNYYSVSQKRLNADTITQKGAKIYELDLTKDDLTKALKNAEYIIHFAAQPGISTSVSLETYVKNNIFGTHQLLKQAVQIKPKLFINIATSSIYGLNATDQENQAPKPASYYGVTKLAAEQLVLAEQRGGHLNAVSLRLFSIYGPRERPDKLFPRLFKAILRDEEFPLYEGAEEHVRSFTYVDDVINALQTIINADQALKSFNGEVFNIGSAQTFTTGEAIQITENILNKKAKKKLLPRRPGDQSVTKANIEKAKKYFGYEPKTTLEKGLQNTAKWYTENIDKLPDTF